MTENRWLFIGTDKRMSICSEIMARRGYSCRAVKTDVYTVELKQALLEFAPHHIVFPVLELKGELPPELLSNGAEIYTGVVSAEWLMPFKQANFSVNHYLKEELFIWENARLTAEAFIHAYYLQTKRTISGKKFHIAGYGRVGKMVADVISSLGGHVTIIARSDAQLGEAVANGFAIERLTSNFKLDAGCLVNTIPAQWLSSVRTDTSIPIFDLASAPGCLTEAGKHEYYTLLPGLPGKYYPIEAATVLADALDGIHRR